MRLGLQVRKNPFAAQNIFAQGQGVSFNSPDLKQQSYSQDMEEEEVKGNSSVCGFHSASST